MAGGCVSAAALRRHTGTRTVYFHTHGRYLGPRFDHVIPNHVPHDRTTDGNGWLTSQKPTHNTTAPLTKCITRITFLSSEGSISQAF